MPFLFASPKLPRSSWVYYGEERRFALIVIRQSQRRKSWSLLGCVGHMSSGMVVGFHPPSASTLTARMPATSL